MKKHWIAEHNRNFKRGGGSLHETSGVVLKYDPTPGAMDEPLKDGETRSFGLIVPAMLMLSLVADGDKVAAQVAHQLNTYPALIEALKQAESLLVTAFGEPAHPPRALENGRAADGIHSIRAIVAAAEAEPEAVS